MKDYWNERYIKTKGAGSGMGSVGEFRAFIQYIATTLEIPFDRTILDYGCGNRFMWSGIRVSNYTGLDKSKVIIDINKRKYPQYKFIMPHELEKQYDVSFCISVIIHAMTNSELENILTDLAFHTNETIIISHWITEPKSIQEHERFWDIKDWASLIEQYGWHLADQIGYEDNLNMVSIFRKNGK